MSSPSAPDGIFAPLDAAGLNRQHVFKLADLPADLLAPMDVQPHERQLILIGHAGRRLWQAVQDSGIREQEPEHPIDHHSQRTVLRWFAEVAPQCRVRLVYPVLAPRMAGAHVGLQALGRLAGWHQPSPFMVGIDAHWGSWFAYRAVALADSDFAPTPLTERVSPCLSCADQPCISACPAHALDSGSMVFAQCGPWRLRPASECALQCVARQACPVGVEHRYEDEQVAHAAALSLQAIRRYL